MSLTQEQFSLLSHGIIDLRGIVTEDTFDYARDCFAALVANDSPNITVWITSDGGSIEYGLGIYDILRNYEGWVTGLVIGRARSVALVILQACDDRQAYSNATVFLHNPIYTVGHEALAQYIRTKDAREFKAMRQRMMGILTSRCKISRREVAQMCNNETTLYVNQAKKAGFVDTLI